MPLQTDAHIAARLHEALSVVMAAGIGTGTVIAAEEANEGEEERRALAGTPRELAGKRRELAGKRTLPPRPPPPVTRPVLLRLGTAAGPTAAVGGKGAATMGALTTPRTGAEPPAEAMGEAVAEGEGEGEGEREGEEEGEAEAEGEGEGEAEAGLWLPPPRMVRTREVEEPIEQPPCARSEQAEGNEGPEPSGGVGVVPGGERFIWKGTDEDNWVEEVEEGRDVPPLTAVGGERVAVTETGDDAEVEAAEGEREGEGERVGEGEREGGTAVATGAAAADVGADAGDGDEGGDGDEAEAEGDDGDGDEAEAEGGDGDGDEAEADASGGVTPTGEAADVAVGAVGDTAEAESSDDD